MKVYLTPWLSLRLATRDCKTLEKFWERYDQNYRSDILHASAFPRTVFKSTLPVIFSILSKFTSIASSEQKTFFHAYDFSLWGIRNNRLSQVRNAKRMSHKITSVDWRSWMVVLAMWRTRCLAVLFGSLEVFRKLRLVHFWKRKLPSHSCWHFTTVSFSSLSFSGSTQYFLAPIYHGCLLTQAVR